jgi:hypothetical protein
MRKVLSLLLTAAAILILTADAANAADERLVGVWKWEDSYFDEDDGETRNSTVTVYFGDDGTIKIEPRYYRSGVDAAYGTYEADGRTVRGVITKIEPSSEDDDGSVNFEKDETFTLDYEFREDKLVTRFWRSDVILESVK